MYVKKSKTKENGDGTITLSYICDPSQIPQEFKLAALKSRFTIQYESHPDIQIDVLRGLLSDNQNRSITIQLIALNGSVPDDIQYANAKTQFDITLTPAITIGDNLLPLDPVQRQTILKKLVVHASDYDFISWLKTRHAFIHSVEVDNPALLRDAVDEAIRREIKVHSRNQVLTDAVAGERAEKFIRLYREGRFKNDRKNFGEGF
jgi:hypothetical protein